jgi:hypothetical protein
LHVVPRVGPFKAVAFKTLTPREETMYMAAFNASIDKYRSLLAGVGKGQFDLANDNFDVGDTTKAGSLPIATKTNEGDWARLQGELSRVQAINRDVLAFGSASK